MVQAATIIARCTTRVVAGRGGSEPHSSGTGFFYVFDVPGGGTQQVFVVITNKHVVAGCDYARFVLSNVPSGLDPDALVAASDLRQVSIDVDVNSQMCVPHPDPKIDLCALVCSPAIGAMASSPGREIYAAFLRPENHLPDEQRSWVRFIESVVMVGYPNGLWDEINDMPIIRRGTTATHALQNHRDRPEFVIDMACMPGSSGSPVFLFEDGLVRAGRDALSPGSRLVLLGVLWGGPQLTLEGRIEVRPVPHATAPVAVTSTPMNLGYVIQAGQIAGIGEEIFRRLGASRPTQLVPVTGTLTPVVKS